MVQTMQQMKTCYFILSFCFLTSVLTAQANKYVYELNATENLLTNEVKTIIAKNIAGKQVIFLGEAVHYSGSDMMAKTEFVKYLVTEHGFTEIAFESDFFSPLFSQGRQNVYIMWSLSEQCMGLWDFVRQKNVSIWGFDNQMRSYYTLNEFVKKLSCFLKSKGVIIEERFSKLTNTLLEKD